MMYIRFVSDSSVNGKGFQATYRGIRGGKVILVIEEFLLAELRPSCTWPMFLRKTGQVAGQADVCIICFFQYKFPLSKSFEIYTQGHKRQAKIDRDFTTYFVLELYPLCCTANSQTSVQ